MTNDPIVTDDGVTYHAWTDGYAVGFRCVHLDGREEFLYLNPSNGDDADPPEPNVFIYHGPCGDPGRDPSLHYYRVFAG